MQRLGGMSIYERRGGGKKKTHMHAVHIRNVKLVMSVFFSSLFLVSERHTPF